MGVRQALRHRLSARAHASRCHPGFMPVLSCGKADNRARQGPVHRAGNGPFQRSGRGIPVCLGTALGQPISVGDKGASEGVSVQLGCWCSGKTRAPGLTEFADGVALCACPPLRRPSRDIRPEPPGGRAGGTASLRPLSCGKGSSCAVGTGWRRLSQPVPPGSARARPRGSTRSVGRGTGHPNSRAADVIRYSCA